MKKKMGLFSVISAFSILAFTLSCGDDKGEQGCTDTTAPTVALDSPLPCYTVPSVTVSGTCTDADSGVAVITVQAGTNTATGTSFPIILSIPADGVYTITAWAEDNCGNIGLDTVANVRVDTTAPLVGISSPLMGVCITTSAVVVDGSVSDFGGSDVALITVQAGAYTATDTSFPIILSIPADGVYTITARVEDNCGNIGPVDTVTNVRVDTTAPLVGISSPLMGVCITTSAVVVDGSISETGSGVALITVQAGAYTATNTSFPIILNIPVDGLYTVSAQVEDNCGNIGPLDTVANVRVDTAIDGLSLSGPASGSCIDSTVVSVTGNAWDMGSGLLQIMVSAVGPATFSATAPDFSAPIDLAITTDGVYQITATAWDNCGNSVVSSPLTDIQVDTVGMAYVNITIPADGGTVYLGDVTVSGTADTDITTVTVTSDQGHSESSPVVGGNWSVILTGVTLPSLTINVAVTDRCGNPGSDSVTVSVSVPPIWYVNITATGDNDGTSWADAFTVIQDAVGAASADEWIWVAKGTYTNSPTSTLSVLTMKAGVDIYGGFTGTESDISERNPATNQTILDGEDTSYSVVTGASNARLDGFTVTGGNAIGTFNLSDYVGGGMYSEAVSGLLVANCTFSGNTAQYGGGMGNYNSPSPTITNCIFSGNTATTDGSGGGMINLVSSSPTITNCIFSGNMAVGNGGGIVNTFDSSPTLINCTFSGNTANWGGGISDWWDTTCIPTITNCIMWGNFATTSWNEIQGGANITYSDIAGGWSGTGNINQDPLFATGPNGDYYLSQTDAGQVSDSPCVDAGSETAVNLGLDDRTTRTDGGLDSDIVDMGYHYEP